MKKSRFSESQIVAILKEADAGLPVKEVCRKHDISSPTYYKWKSKYGGMEASDLRRVKELEMQLEEDRLTAQRARWTAGAVADTGHGLACV